MRHQSTQRPPVAREPRRKGKPLALAAAAAVLPIVALSAASPAHAQDEPFADPAQAGASWLASQSEGASWGGGDVGTSLDALIGLLAAGVGGDQVQATLEWLNEPDVLGAYVYPPSDESDDPQLNAGGAGKVMYVVATAGGDPTDFGGIKLAEVVAEARTDEGGFGDGQVLTTAWATLGLSRTGESADEEAVASLLAAQCDDGGFSWGDVDGGDDCVSDPDTTGVVASALRTDESPEAAEAFEAALGWLESAQGDSGGFDGGFGENASSTAYAAQALLAGERVEAAERATVFLLGLQVACGDDAQGAIVASEPEDPEFGEMMRLLATAQALIPLAGQNLATLDGSQVSAEVPEIDCSEGGEGEAAAAGDDESGSTDWVPWVIAGAALVLIVAVLLIVRARRGGEGSGVATAEASSDGAGSADPGDEGKDKGGE